MVALCPEGSTSSSPAIEATAGHDEASLASRGIEAQQISASHDEASLASRGIQASGTAVFLRILRRIPIMGPEEHGGHCELEFDGLEVSGWLCTIAALTLGPMLSSNWCTIQW